MKITDKIDHTILRADARAVEVRRYCSEAVEHHFASVCVNTCHVPLAAELLRDSGVKVCCQHRLRQPPGMKSAFFQVP